MKEFAWTPPLREVLDGLCAQVSLKPAGTPEGLAPLDKNAALWRANYAAVLLWVVEPSASLAEGLATAEGWFADYLAAAESMRHGRVLDGYLVLAIGQKPGPDVAPVVRHAEMSSHVCRKHVVWPDEPGKNVWSRLEAVTLLGLPEPLGGVAREAHWPALSDEEEELWSRIKADGPARAAQAEITPK